MDETNLISQKLIVKLKFKYNPWFFILDQLLRIIILTLYLQSYFSTWIFILIQLALIGFEFYRLNKYKSKLIKKYNVYLNKKYTIEKPVLELDEEIPETLAIYQLLFGFIFSFWFFYHTFESHAWYLYILIFILAAGGAIICMLPLLATIKFREDLGIISAKPLRVKTFRNQKNLSTDAIEDVNKSYPDIFQTDKLIGYGIIELDTVDQNDVRIAKLESEVKSINHRSETWMLESVFLGGLAFSGFLTVASANFLGKEPVVFNSFLTHLKEYYNKCAFNEILSWLTEIQNHFFRNDLYIIIMLLCLLSSVFFLLVLTLRLRMNSLYLNMDHLIRILVIFNSKEEELFNSNLNDSQNFQLQRLEKIQAKINSALIDSEKLLKELRPTSILMNTYRNIAVVLFYCVLIISGFYFMPIVAFLIFSLAIFTQIFRIFETYTKVEKIRNLLNRH